MKTKKNKDFWINFYKTKKSPSYPTPFAKFIRKFIKDKISFIYCLGSGNGRDAYYFGRKWKVLGIDYAFLPESKRRNISFLKLPVEEFIEKNRYNADLTYARFFFHSIDDKLFNKILKWSKGLIAFEVRSKKDINLKKIFKFHSRIYRNGKEILDILFKNNYELKYFEENRGLARFKDEDPYIIRIVAKKI